MRRRALVWRLALCLLLGGCSLVDLYEESLALPPGTRPLIKIGLAAPFEGRYRTLGYEVLYAVKLAVRERNAGGGVAGHMVELIALNDGDDPDTSRMLAYKFAVDERLMGVIGPFSQATVRAGARVYGEHSLVAITPATCAPDSIEPGNRAVFLLGADAKVLASALADRLPVDAPATVLHAQGGTLGDELIRVGWPVVDAPRWAADGPHAAALAALREHPARVLLYDGDALGAAELLVEIRQAGIDAPLWGGPALARTQLAQIAGGAVVGSCHALTAPLWADLRSSSGFVAGYRELSDTMPGPWAGLAYDATVLLLDAIERAIAAEGSPTREGVIAALNDGRGPDGRPVFHQRHRRQAEVQLYCYEPGDRYPGTLRR